MINLNNIPSGENVKIFNDGKAGRVLNVTIKDVKEKQPTDNINFPDYNIIYSDIKDNELKDGFYLDIKGATPEKTQAIITTVLGRLVQIVKSLLGEDYIFPDYGDDYKVVMKSLFNLIKENKNKRKVNLFISYGTKTRPSDYLKVRYFNKFIESAEITEDTTELLTKPNDLMVKLIKPDVKGEEAVAEDFFNI